MSYRFVVLMDMKGDDVKEAYDNLLTAMAHSKNEVAVRFDDKLIGWETSDEAYNLEDGTRLDTIDFRRSCIEVLDKREKK